MTRPDPATATPRTDLPWLRHRRAAEPPPPVTPPPRTSPLDLSAAPPASSLDLAPPPAAGTNALDLGPPPQPSPEVRADRARGAPADLAPGLQPIKRYEPRRVRAGEDVLLAGSSPTLTLTRLQSGTGAVRVRLVAPGARADLRLGCAYQLVDGTGLVQREPGPQTAPADGRRPVIRASYDAGEVLTVDLVQVRRLSRMVVFLWSANGQPVQGSGTLVVEMLAGTRVRIPLDRPGSAAAPGVVVPLSIYGVDGEIVLRNEGVVVDGPVRAAALAFGFDRITWVDDHTALV